MDTCLLQISEFFTTADGDQHLYQPSDEYECELEGKNIIVNNTYNVNYNPRAK